jgi:hypothetical protein
VIEQYPDVGAQLKSLLDRWMDDDPKSARRGKPAAAASRRSAEAGSMPGFPAVSGNLS